LTHRSNRFITMLAPLRDYLSPKDPKASPLLCATKGRYFTRMSVKINPNEPNLAETRWIISEDINVEHLLDVFTRIDANSYDVWDAYINFMVYLDWHKKRLTILKPNIEGLPDGHRSKPESLFVLSRSFSSAGNQVERKRLLSHALKLLRKRGNDYHIATTLVELSDANRFVGLYEEGIQQAKEALGVYERFGETALQVDCWIKLAWLLCRIKQFDAAEEAALRAIGILPEEGEQFRACRSHRALGRIHQSKGEIERAVHHFEVAIGIASSVNLDTQLFWVHCDMSRLFRSEDRLDDAQIHVEHAKSHTTNSAYHLGCVAEEQARVWYEQDRLEEAKSEALRAVDIYDKLGVAGEMKHCRELLQNIQKKLNTPVSLGQPGFNRELL